MDTAAKNISRCRILQTLKPGDNIMKALDTMTMLGVTSLPVIDPESDKPQGFFDALDAVDILCQQLATSHSSKVTSNDDGDISKDDLQMLSDRANDFLLSSVDLSERGSHTQYIRLPQDAKASEVVKEFIKGVHRVGLEDGNHKLVGIISQSDMIAFLNSNPKAIPPMRSKVTAGAMKLLHRNVTSVSPDLPTWKAFQELQKSGRTAIAVKNAEGQLVGVLSSSDCKYISRTFQDLLLPVSKFVAKARRAQSRKSDWLVSFTADADMTDIIEAMTFDKVHRVYIVTETEELKAVVTATDVLRELFN